MSLPPSFGIWETIGNYLSKWIRFNRIIYGWPDFNDTLEMPCISIHNRGDPIFQPGPARLVSIKDANLIITDTVYEVGDWVTELQIDLWNRTKQEQLKYQNDVFQLFHNQNDRMLSCLSLPIEKHYNQIATYHFRSINDLNDQMSTTRAEWRTKIQVTVDTKAYIDRKNMPLIKETAVTLELFEGPDALTLGDS